MLRRWGVFQDYLVYQLSWKCKFITINFRNALHWPNYIMNSVDKTKSSCSTNSTQFQNEISNCTFYYHKSLSTVSIFYVVWRHFWMLLIYNSSLLLITFLFNKTVRTERWQINIQLNIFIETARYKFKFNLI